MSFLGFTAGLKGEEGTKQKIIVCTTFAKNVFVFFFFFFSLPHKKLITQEKKGIEAVGGKA